MGYSENAAVVRADIANHSQNIIIEFFIKFPQHQDMFDNYKGQDPASLKSTAKFEDLSIKFVTKLINILDIAVDSGALAAECAVLAKMRQHSSLGIHHFNDISTVIVAYVKKLLGGAYDPGWQSRMDALTSCLSGKLS